jgi:hypothetical protein
MRKDLHSGKTVVRRKYFADLVDTVEPRVDDHYFDIADTRYKNLRAVRH